MIEKRLYSESLDLLRFPLAVIIVMGHVCYPESFQLIDRNLPVHDLSFIHVFDSFQKAFFTGQSVPIYFFISGFVFFLGLEFTWTKYVQKLKNRVKSLFIPYVFWNLLALFVLWCKALCFPSIAPEFKSFLPDFTLKSFLSIFWMCPGSTMPINYPLWFLRDLMLVVLLTPLIYYMVKLYSHYWILLLGVCWFVFPYLNMGEYSSLMTALFFFTWGAYFNIKGKDIRAGFKKYFALSLFAYPILGILYIVSEHYFPYMVDNIKNLNILVGILFAYNLSSWLLAHHVCKVSALLVSASFFIYVSHPLVAGGIAKLCFVLIKPQTNFGMFAVYACGVALTIGILLFVFCCLKKYAPSFLRMIARV